MCLTSFQDLTEKLVAFLLLEVLLEFWADENQELENFDGVFSELKVVDFYQVHDQIEAV
jgi:hypothetical protein